MSQYSIFGAKLKEPPQLTHARVILSVGRDASEADIKTQYRKLAMAWHPDRHQGKPTQQEATQRTELYTGAYNLLVRSDKRQQAGDEFGKALEHPFVVGERVFCLGSLYGTRVFVPDLADFQAITDSGRMLTSGGHDEPACPAPSARPPAIHGSRHSIMESQLADDLETFYAGNIVGRKNAALLQDAFENRARGGLDDLVWIRGNDMAVAHFLNREFREAERIFEDINERVADNIIFMYRLGICIEAALADAGNRTKDPTRWQQGMEKAICLYLTCLDLLALRRESYRGEPGQEQEVARHDPESMLTVMMQLADAHEQIGDKRRARELWLGIQKIDPSCYEAGVRVRRLAKDLSPWRRLLGLLGPASPTSAPGGRGISPLLPHKAAGGVP